jgi:BCCT family betaine/carnitine transporter|tara:strand:+ start:3733 stop:3912 length:180 start_codon:yes stop_codon:yes gene_type:complete
MSSNPYVTDYQIGQDNVQRLGLDVHKPVFTISALLIVGFILFTLLMPESAESALGGAKA